MDLYVPALKKVVWAYTCPVLRRFFLRACSGKYGSYDKAESVGEGVA